MEDKLSFGIRLKALRKSCGLTQEELAERIERSVDAVSALERGHSYPNFKTLEGLSRALDVPIKELFQLDEEDQSSPKREKMMAELAAIARTLTDADLELTISQIKAIADARRPRQRKRP